ncbi:Complement Factor H-Related Protein 4 [Manis pentadactyla]|nr:Complement Factor H-Related Protein 4 [Manis pentadactyla]
MNEDGDINGEIIDMPATTDRNSVLSLLLGDSRFRDKVLRRRTCTWLSPGAVAAGGSGWEELSSSISQSEKHSSPPPGLGILSSRTHLLRCLLP